ncbi:myosin phosphatase Rho-interacting protein-like [Notolabrus celidotus]|uniref:myosin phosphatase Rho-interacting protein-like n=1 Tax=Notolabrus celidotus TaxID=1203425 RepID=UPI00148FEB29|nr:myosin phosphatase Rho-interacting protein-like [Notolabrus celidotus]
MSANRATSPCNKFQENIFNKSKCQNCFKPRELHLLSDKNMEQVRPVYGGWLCLAPEGTDFENPVQRSRKWQRRFFILYEDGCLSFALDEQPSTLPQGTMNLTVSSDVSNAEARTGQRNALCISTPQQEVYIRGDSKDIINGWSDQFSSFLHTSKQNQKKKRKVEPVTSQEPSPAKMAATDQSFSSSESLGESRSDDASQSVSPLCRDEERLFDSVCSPDLLSRNTEADRNNIRTKIQNQTQDRNQVLNMDQDQDRRRGDSSETMLGVDGQEDKSAVSRKRGRESRSNTREKLPSCGDLTQLCVSPPQRRTRSLDSRTTDTVTTLDLLNFKKGWMVKLDDNEQWKKFWFVLSTNTLRFYRDSLAEECSDLEGEIELTHCYNVSECDVQRTYGFLIQTLQGVFTLSAMTAGSRRSWIQALMRNVHPANAPDVTSLPGLRVSPELLHRPDLTLDSPSSERDAQIKHVSVAQRRKDGRNRTLYWTGFKSQTEPSQDPQRNGAVSTEGRRRKEERRRRYEGMLDLSLSPDSQQRTEEECWRKEEVEECWRKVETLFFRPENSVPVFTESRDSEELLDQYRTKVEDLKARLEDSEHLRLKLEDQLKAATDHDQSSDIQVEALRGTRESSQQVKTPPVTPTILLLDSEGNLRDLLHTGTTPSSSSPSSLVSHIEGKTNSDLQNHQGCERVHGSDIIMDIRESSLITDQSADIDDSPQSICVEQHLPPDHEVQRRLTQDMQLLLCQEEALNQRNQELLHQLTEANHEIEGLRAEISRRSSETQQLPYEELQHLLGEEPGHLHEEEEEEGEEESEAVEVLQAGLILRSQELLEAQSLISSLVESLRETEELLEVSDAAEKGEELKEDTEEEEELRPQCFEEPEVKLETQPYQSEQNFEGLHMQNTEIEEVEKCNHQLTEEAEPEFRGWSHMDEESSRVLVSVEEKICAVIEDMMKRMKAVDKLWELMQEVEVSLSDEEEEPMMKSQLKMEEVLWRSMLTKLETNGSKDLEEKPEKELLREVTERMMVEKQILCLGLSLIPETGEGKDLMDINLICRTDEIHFRDVTKMKISLLNLIASSVSSSISSTIQDRLHLLATRLSDSQLSDDSWFRLSLFAAAESLSCSRLNHLQSKCERKPEDKKQTPPTSSTPSLCSNCVDLLKENQELREKLTNRGEQQSSSSSMREQTDSSCQTEETQTQDVETEMEYQIISEENVEQAEEEEEDKDEEKMEEDSMKGEESAEADIEEILLLRGLVKELEEQLFVMKEGFDGKLSSVQRQHEKEMDKLKATCGRGLGSMEESHSKVVEELQRRHHQEVERLLMERDRLLEEESAATATAIEAIKNAHRVELQEENRRHQCECSSGNTPLEEIYRRHREELASSQRELQVLSQQFSLRCLEVGHLVQALEAERKALSVCQQENQHLRTRNQELSAHLAAEITRLCSQVKQDDLPLSQRMDVYEMEITLRVKESEVQSLIQETTSLKDELQTAQSEKRNATKKYKEMLTELNVLRAKTERETHELRENLRLAHCALDQTYT